MVLETAVAFPVSLQYNKIAPGGVLVCKTPAVAPGHQCFDLPVSLVAFFIMGNTNAQSCNHAITLQQSVCPNLYPPFRFKFYWVDMCFYLRPPG